MRIKDIELEWFRGASDCSKLVVDGKSVVVYGDNGSGKSSFVDAFEYILTRGKIQHLRHEHTNKANQRFSVRNTEASDDQDCTATVHFIGDTEIGVQIPSSRSVIYNSCPDTLIAQVQNWNRQSHILRQDEVADFVKGTKSDKYTALSPLLGLQEYEDMYDNIRKLKRNIELMSNYRYIRLLRESNRAEILRVYNSLEEDEILSIVGDTLAIYEIDNPELEEAIEEGSRVVKRQIDQLDPEIIRYFTVENLLKEPILTQINEYKQLIQSVQNVVSEVLEYRIAVLEKAENYLELEDLEELIECPVCGTEMDLITMREHVVAELQALNELQQLNREITEKKREITLTLSRYQSILSKRELQDWFNLPQNIHMIDIVNEMLDYSLPDQSIRWEAIDLENPENLISSINAFLAPILEYERPNAGTLYNHLSIFNSIANFKEYTIQEDQIEKIVRVLDVLKTTKLAIREKIVEISTGILESITEDIQMLWRTLHPYDPIDEIHLIKSETRDTGLEIVLRFHGKELLSPLMTLSEGHRNSLGLCVFIALANQEPEDHPIFLDDIVSSLDREHRGFIKNMLQSELENRQVFLFTHDREWYDELKRMLHRGKWQFKELAKWTKPQDGIRVIPTHFTFDEATHFLPQEVNQAGNACRTIMDEEYAILCEKLKVPLPYIRGPASDHRTWKEFSDALISYGKKNFQVRNEAGDYERYKEPRLAIMESQVHLVTWANRGTHGGQINPQEVMYMIEVCEKALNYFYKCTECEKKLWHATSSNHSQCECGKIRWRF